MKSPVFGNNFQFHLIMLIKLWFLPVLSSFPTLVKGDKKIKIVRTFILPFAVAGGTGPNGVRAPWNEVAIILGIIFSSFFFFLLSDLSRLYLWLADDFKGKPPAWLLGVK
jgi:hypothetical protein